ncbi:MAG: PilZ domain-containing protein [Bdellovibrionales bacterium]|nr:PilZ domain-containing protein [Bdellovibrionales bacterium]
MGNYVRKHPRYKAKVLVRFSDKRTDGILLDVSREGALIVSESNQQKSVGSFIVFSAFLDGALPPKETSTQEIALNKIFKSKEENEKVDNPFEVKISAKVVRHAQYKGRNAMGLQFMEIDHKHLLRWLRFLGDIKEKQEVLPFGTQSISNRKEIKKEPGFTIRFQNKEFLKEFLPHEPTGSFFIPTKRLSEKDKKVRVTLVHPTEEKLLEIEGVVKSSCNSKIDNTPQDGILCSFASLSKDLIQKINNFLDENFYLSPPK